ncbi:MAG: hypothetical protein K1X44_08720 [Alphaproteobacteria bacterium]|nr:hypothetical protein [Alphaproteobacteria bacterium]
MKITTLTSIAVLAASIVLTIPTSYAEIFCEGGFDDKGACVENMPQNQQRDPFRSSNRQKTVLAYKETRTELKFGETRVTRTYKDTEITYIEYKGTFKSLDGLAQDTTMSGKSLLANAENAYANKKAIKTTVGTVDTYEIDLGKGYNVTVTHDNVTGTVEIYNNTNLTQEELDKVLGAFDGQMTFLTGSFAKKTPLPQSLSKGLTRSNTSVGEGNLYNANNGKDGENCASK